MKKLIFVLILFTSVFCFGMNLGVKVWDKEKKIKKLELLFDELKKGNRIEREKMSSWIFTAIRLGRLDFIRFILEKDLFDPTFLDLTNMLLMASMYDNPELVEYLLLQKSDWPSSVIKAAMNNAQEGIKFDKKIIKFSKKTKKVGAEAILEVLTDYINLKKYSGLTGQDFLDFYADYLKIRSVLADYESVESYAKKFSKYDILLALASVIVVDNVQLVEEILDNDTVQSKLKGVDRYDLLELAVRFNAAKTLHVLLLNIKLLPEELGTLLKLAKSLGNKEVGRALYSWLYGYFILQKEAKKSDAKSIKILPEEVIKNIESFGLEIPLKKKN